MDDEWKPPRRICLERLTPAELAIVAATEAVEAAGCDVRLTRAVCLLSQARFEVADFVDGVERPVRPRVELEKIERALVAWYDGSTTTQMVFAIREALGWRPGGVPTHSSARKKG